MNPTRTFALLLAAVSLTASVVDDAGAAGAGQPIWVGGKDVKINPQASHWRRDLEAQLQVHPRAGVEYPAITTLSPNPVQRGQTLTITGSHFNRMLSSGGTYTVSFQAGSSRIAAAAIATSDTQIRVVVPASATTGLVRLIAGTGTQWTEGALPLDVTTPAPATGTLRFTNSSQFEVSALIVNGQPMIPAGQVLASGSWVDVDGPSGVVPYRAEVGFGSSTYFVLSGSATILNGLVVAQSIPRVTASMALTFGASSTQWDGVYYDSNLGVHMASIVFRSNGTYDLYQDNVLVRSAQYTDGPFGAGQSDIRFSVDGVVTSIDYPYDHFTLRNGPSSSPNVQYTRR